MIAAYQLGFLTGLWARNVITTDYVSLINIAEQAPIIPEFLLENCQPEPMADALIPLFSNTSERTAQLSAFPAALAKLGVYGEPAAAVAANTLVQWVNE